ncbi:site-specific DNA-methyltransferase [Mycolicibacter algericus DSM 45454]|uniref:Methyltransferase n=1 Tax=Mycolicibacter algericus DSM 45454 TaxID=723879 RepID=A0ABX3RKF7_MYCAL|nr:site-specific DNA-methyltransferase [Mycolicibacter algericus DSM 45454]
MMRSRPGTSPLDIRLFAAHGAFLAERPPASDEDVHMLSATVDHVIERCTAPGDLVFDPFAGFGTTLDRAVALGRAALGIELLPERVDYLRRRVPGAHVLQGDARELLEVIRGSGRHLPDASVDLVLTSPPYMTRQHHEADPLTGYEENNGDYGRYLAELGAVAAQCARLLAPAGFAVWNVADIHHLGSTTHLISDCARVLEHHLTRLGTTAVVWDRYPHDLIADALLVFQRIPAY